MILRPNIEYFSKKKRVNTGNEGHWNDRYFGKLVIYVNSMNILLR